METPGRCLCGAITFTGLGAVAPAEVCHCTICRHHGAGPLMSTSFAGGIRLDTADELRWYASSAIAERGFCSRCGTILFWRMAGARTMSVSAHAIAAEPPGIREHVFVDQKPGWYDFADHAPRVTSAEMQERLRAWKAKRASEA
jgi:hypothetical protein